MVSRRTSSIRTPDGESIAFDEWGDGATLLLLLHGAMMSRGAWREFVDRLGSAGGPGLRMVAADLPGFGDSSKPRTGYDYSSQAERIAFLLESLVARRGSSSRVIVAGHSMGAGIALNIALGYSDLLDGLIVFDGGLAGAKGGGSINTIAGGQQVPQLERGFITRYVRNWLYRDDPELCERLVSDALAVPEWTFGGVRAAVAGHDLSDPATNFPDIPVLVARGEFDRTRTLEEAEEIASRFKVAKLVEIARAGHCPTIEQPAQSAEAIAQWLREHRFIEGGSNPAPAP
jgi:pimeloyl-ACP methyl ester carboxylesterase